MSNKWFEDSIGYQIYPRTFCDSNGDGIGDLQGIISKLPYLKELGVDILWIGPFLKSPQIDHGYDISDHYMIDECYGSISDLIELIWEADKLEIKIMMDLVLNHTSKEHLWFKEEVDYLKEHPNHIEDLSKTLYIWRKAKYDNHHQRIVPNNWGSFFNTSAWEYEAVLDSYYLHVFDKTMPDLNYKNPQAFIKMSAVAKYYLDKGIKGFRLDAISHLEKDDTFTDSLLPINAEGFVCDPSKFSNKDQVYDYLDQFKRVVFDHYDILVIGEVGGSASIDSALKYANKKAGALDMVFNFDTCWCNNLYGNEDLLDVRVDVIKLKEQFNKWYQALNHLAYQAIYWLNHDHPRLMSQYGNATYYSESAKMLCGLLYLQSGLPFIYNGEEIGMCNVDYDKIEDFFEPTTIDYYKKAILKRSPQAVLAYIKSAYKDNARGPMQFTKNFDDYQKMTCFVNHNVDKISVEVQSNDPNSILGFYKRVLTLRRKYSDLFNRGAMIFDKLDDPALFIYQRTYQKAECIVIGNFSINEISYELATSDRKIWINNYQDPQIIDNKITLRPYELIVIGS